MNNSIKSRFKPSNPFILKNRHKTISETNKISLNCKIRSKC